MIAQAGTSACPVPLSAVPANFQRHIDPLSPVPMRMMAAKALVPMGPRELTTALFVLTFDSDAGVRETAIQTAAGLPDRILSMALRDETADAAVLHYFAGAMSGRDEYLEMLVLNTATADATVQRLTEIASERITELVADNQLRTLRFPDIVRALSKNPATRPSTLDKVCDFCVRSGLCLEDQPAYRAARARIHGGPSRDEELARKIDEKRAREQAEAEAALELLGAAGAAGDSEEPDPKRLSITQQILRLGVAKKVEWANTKGNREVRTLLLRDPNKLVQLAVIHSPRITLGEIASVAQSRTAGSEVLQFIYDNRQLMKNYQIKLNVISNPKVPVGVSMRFLSSLRTAEVKGLARNKNVSHGLATAAKNLLEKKTGAGS